MKRTQVPTSLLLLVVALVMAACTGSTPPTLAEVVVPPGFPSGAPIPQGAITRGYTGSAETGFELNVMTAVAHDELRQFIVDAVAASDSWSLAPADGGLSVLPGYDADWAIFTREDQVVSGPFGTYEGGIGVDGSEISILLSPTLQPPDDAEPPVLPPRFQLPRPTTTLVKAAYTHGKVNVTYVSGESVFDALIDRFRVVGWEESDVVGYGNDASERWAVGDMANWRITVRDFFEPSGGPIILEFENLTHAFP